MKSYYAVLELPDFSDVKSIVASYRQLAMKWHPDRNKSRDASQIFIEIQTAYEILRNDEQRKYYDAWLREVKKDNMGYSPQTDNIFQDTKMARQAREYAYKYADMSFDDFATKAKIKTKQAAGTLLKWVAGFTVAFALKNN